MTDYQRRALAQIEAWAAGQPRHEPINDECCPDFSCCNPDLFVTDAAARRVTAEASGRR